MIVTPHEAVSFAPAVPFNINMANITSTQTSNSIVSLRKIPFSHLSMSMALVGLVGTI